MNNSPQKTNEDDYFTEDDYKTIKDVIDNKPEQTGILRDNFNKVLGVNIGSRTLATYEYNPNNGKIRRINYGNGFSEEYKYNNLEMLEEVCYTYNDGTTEPAFRYTYNPNGTLDIVTDYLSGKETKYTYDDKGRLASVSETDSNNSSYKNDQSVEYNDNNSLKSLTYKVDYKFNTLLRTKRPP